MKATIHTYKGNATLFFNDCNYNITWDGYEWDTKAELEEWIAEQLNPVRNADNYDDIWMSLYIATNHLCNE